MPNTKQLNTYIQTQSGHIATFQMANSPIAPNTNRYSNTNYIPIVRIPHNWNNSSIIQQTASLSFCSNTVLYAAKMPHRSSDSPMNYVNTACMSRASVRSFLVNMQQHQLVQTFLQHRGAQVAFEMS